MDSFPIMSEQDVGDITFGNHLILFLCAYFLHQDFIILIGIFQLKRARSYAEEKCSTTNLTGVVQYAIQRCLIIPNLIRIPTQSAHVDRIIYHPTIQYTHDHILGWWCDCYIGSRFIGCCSHISSAIWFLSCERWKMQQRQMPSGSYMGLATDAIQVSDFYDSSDDDDTTRYSLL